MQSCFPEVQRNPGKTFYLYYYCNSLANGSGSGSGSGSVWHRRAGRTAAVATGLGWFTACIVLAGMYSRLPG